MVKSGKPSAVTGRLRGADFIRWGLSLGQQNSPSESPPHRPLLDGPAHSISHYCWGDLAAYRRSDRVFSEQRDIAPLSQVIHKVASTTTLVSSLHPSRIIKISASAESVVDLVSPFHSSTSARPIVSGEIGYQQQLSRSDLLKAASGYASNLLSQYRLERVGGHLHAMKRINADCYWHSFSRVQFTSGKPELESSFVDHTWCRNLRSRRDISLSGYNLASSPCSL
jgi:hypothetical protein